MLVTTGKNKSFTEPQDMNKDEEEIWEVKEFVNSRRVKGVVQYRVVVDRLYIARRYMPVVLPPAQMSSSGSRIMREVPYGTTR